MIGRLTGILLEKRPPMIALDVQGVAYELDVPMSTLYQLPATGNKMTLFTHLVVRDDAHLLYGFATDDERQLFRQLLRVSGVGARTALAVLSGLSVAELHQTVATQDASRLTVVPGIGKKTAERLMLELKDRLTGLIQTEQSAVVSKARGDALRALLALGYSEKEANAALSEVSKELTVSEAIRHALKQLSKSS
ncbi:MAG: Holliday junction branch migration protein RuvA [Betaproteobacteria bacterium]|nr:MAG: Holliday junction branch migration protein RuvA [Betaproteobacteria bacterium]